ncbi:MAG: DNA translocase FtsK [Gemmatimonadota bacterium]|nr:MAG: DNA translocase FtsK [Gemmatimonadota bacterium]
MAVTPRHRQELLAIVSLLLGVFVGLTLLPWDVTGAVGRIIGRFLWMSLGVGAGLLPLLGLGVALAGFGRVPRLDVVRVAVLLGGLVLLIPFSIAVVTGARGPGDFPPDYDAWSTAQRLTGILPALIATGLSGAIGVAGAVIVGVLALSALTMYAVDWHPFRRLARGAGRGRRNLPEPWVGVPTPEEDEEEVAGPAAGPERLDSAGAILRRITKRRPRPEDAADRLPPVELLHPPSSEAEQDWEDEIERQGQVLIDTLATFRVEGSIVGRTTGPVVTQYEIAPAPGVKVGRIAALADDLALAMRAQSIRIVAPIPGRGAVGVEVPNPTARIVTIRELLETGDWEGFRGILPIALGRNLEGKPVIGDLARMPHLLIAGATGTGKSICINSIITSLIYRYTPLELRMIMIDPKMVELSMYNALPHLRHPVVTNNREAAQALKWVMVEMERRYELFHANGARQIQDFNRYLREGRQLVLPNGRGEAGSGKGSSSDQAELDLEPPPYDEGPLPYIIVFVDELADLMMTVQGEVEKPLAILAQKARATGIHLVLATQRPSVNVITGLIKANFPCRIAFRVASKVDSRTILDQNGAETLLGNGDMLFLPPGKSEPVRVQGSFVSTGETEKLTKWYAEMAREAEAAPAAEEEDIIAVIEAMEEEEGTGGGGGAPGGDRDALFKEAAQVCISNQLGSTSLLQRKLRIGYGRAARIIDQLHEAGILGPPDGSKPRDVLIGMGELDEYT